MTPERVLVMMYKVVKQHTKKPTDLLQAESNTNTQTPGFQILEDYILGPCSL